jgi:RNA polymerase sigma factor (sigma-70 family)
VEVSALKPTALPSPRGSGSLLRLQSDERLIALTRRGQQAAFEALFSRYHSRLLAFCRHMLNSKEDAEDVLQEVFAAAFNAILADEREINVRPWLYRIARNRSLNHLRRASAIGVDSMDIHYADHGMSTGEKVLRRESFRQLIGDVQKLPETQRTALLLREIDALSYEQIAQAMETTVPSVKSLLVRARISLAEASEARQLSCAEVRSRLGEAAEGLVKVEAAERRHMRDCERCRAFRKHLKDNNHALAAILPVGPLLLLKKLVLAKFGSTASAGGAHAVGAGGMGMGGLATAGAGALATKAAATLAAAALVTAGAVEVDHSGTRRRHHSTAVTASAGAVAAASGIHPVYGAPAIARSTAQPSSSGIGARAAAGIHHKRVHKHPLVLPTPSVASEQTPAVAPAAAPVKPAEEKPPVTQVTTESTPLPSPSDTTSTTSEITTTPTAPPAEEASPPATTTPAAETPPPPPPPASPPAETGTTTGTSPVISPIKSSSAAGAASGDATSTPTDTPTAPDAPQPPAAGEPTN